MLVSSHLFREEAKAYFWKRLNGPGDDDDDDDDEEEDESNHGGREKVSKGVSALQQQLAHLPMLQGPVSELRSCSCQCEAANDLHKEVYNALLKSSCMPKPWMQLAFLSLYAPAHLALDLPQESLASGRHHTSPSRPAPEAAYNALGEDIKPFEHLLVGGDHKNSVHWQQHDQHEEKPSGNIEDIDEDVTHSDIPEGDVDAFSLICALATALSRIDKQVPASASIIAQSPSPDAEGLVSCLNSSELFEIRGKEAYESVPVHALPSAEDLSYEISTGLQVDSIDHLEVLAAGLLPTSLLSSDPCETPTITVTGGDSFGVGDGVVGDDVCSASFVEAFELVTSPTAHELTGAVFTWKIIGVDSFASTSNSSERVSFGQCRFRVNVALTAEMEDAICDRSMHNSMHNVDDNSLQSEETACEGGDKAVKEVDDEEEDEDEEEEEEEGNLRKVSRRLRARLLSLCGSVAYLLGDAMGGYQ